MYVANIMTHTNVILLALYSSTFSDKTLNVVNYRPVFFL